MSRYVAPYAYAQDANGTPMSGAKLFFYVAGTSTPATTWSNVARTTANANPVVADSAGRFPSVYLDPAVAYKSVLQTASGVQIWTADPVNEPEAPQEVVELADLSYTVPMTGAVPRGVIAKLADFVSVKDFGAKGDGTTDDTLAFQRAADASPFVFVPPGSYRITQVTFNTAAMRLMGCGRGVSILKLYTSSTQNAVVVEGTVGSFPNPAGDVWGGLIEGLTFDGTNAPNMTQPAVNCISAHGMVVRNCLFNKCASGVRLKDCHVSVVEDCAFWDLKAATGFGIQVDGYGDQFIDKIYIDGTIPGGWNFEPMAGIQCLSTGNMIVNRGDIVHCRVGIDINPKANGLVEWCYVGQVYMDQCSDYGIRVNVANGGTVRGCVFEGTWSSTAGTGVRVSADPGTTLDGLTFRGMRVYNNVGNGIEILSGANYVIQGCRIGANGRKVTGTCNTSGTTVNLTGSAEANTVMANKPCLINGVSYIIDQIVTAFQIKLRTSAGNLTNATFSFGGDAAGVSLSSATSSIIISDNLFGGIDTLAANQAWGVYINPNVQLLHISDNIFRPHTQAAIGWLNTGNYDCIIKDNSGIDDSPNEYGAGPTLTLGLAGIAKLTTTTTVTAIAGPRWRSREVILIPVAGDVQFTAGATIANSYLAPSLKPCRIVSDGTTWYVGG